MVSLLCSLKPRRRRKGSFSTDLTSVESDTTQAAAGAQEDASSAKPAVPLRPTSARSNSEAAEGHDRMSEPSVSPQSKMWSPSWRSSLPSPMPYPHGKNGDASTAQTSSVSSGGSPSARISWFRPSAASSPSKRPPSSAHRYSVTGYRGSKLPDTWTPTSHTSTSSSSTQPSPSLHGRSRFASEDTSATTATWESRPDRESPSKVPDSISNAPVQGWFGKTIQPLTFKKRVSMTPSTSPQKTSDTPRWKDPWSNRSKQNTASLVASLGSQPITSSPASEADSTSATAPSPTPYQPLFGPQSVFSKPITQAEEQWRPFITRSGSSQMRLSPQLQRASTQHASSSKQPIPQPESSQLQPEQRPQKDSVVRRPRSASFSDLRTAARDAARKQRHPSNLPSSPSMPLQYVTKPTTLACLPIVSTRPRLHSVDTTPVKDSQLLSIPSRSSLNSNRESISAQSLLRNMESFAREREAWKSGTRKPRDRRLMSMPVGRRPNIFKSDPNETTTPQSCAFLPATFDRGSDRDETKSKGLSWLKGKGKGKATAQDLEEWQEGSREPDDMFRTPTPNQLFSRPRINPQILPEFSFENISRDEVDHDHRRADRPRTSSLSALEHMSRYSVTSSGHFVEYGVAVGNLSRDQLAEYRGQSASGRTAQERRLSDRSGIRRTSRSGSYRLPARHAPTPPDHQHVDPSQEPAERVIFEGQYAMRDSSASAAKLQVQQNGRAGYTPPSPESNPQADRTDSDRQASQHSDQLRPPSEGKLGEQSRPSSSAPSDDRHTNFADLFYHPPPTQNEHQSRPVSSGSQLSSASLHNRSTRLDTVPSASSGVRQSLESGQVTEDSHDTNVDSQHVVYVPQSGSQTVQGSSPDPAPTSEPAAASPNMVRLGSFKQPQKPAVIVERTRHSFMPDLGDDEDEDSDNPEDHRGRRVSSIGDDRSSGGRSFIDFDHSPPRLLENHRLRHYSSEQSFLEDFSPPSSPPVGSMNDYEEGQMPRRPGGRAAATTAARRSSPTISQQLDLLHIPNQEMGLATPDNFRGSFTSASSRGSFNVESFPRPPSPHNLPLPPSVPSSQPSRPSLYSHDSAVTTRALPMHAMPSHPELRIRPSIVRSDTDTTVYTFAPESYTTGAQSRSQLHLPSSTNNSNFFTANSSGPSAYATPAEELESSAEGQDEALQEEYFSPRRREMSQSVSGPVARALEQDDDFQRSRTWSSSFIDFWRHSFGAVDELGDPSSPSGESRRPSSSYSHARTQSDPVSPALAHRALDSPDESRSRR